MLLAPAGERRRLVRSVAASFCSWFASRCLKTQPLLVMQSTSSAQRQSYPSASRLTYRLATNLNARSWFQRERRDLAHSVAASSFAPRSHRTASRQTLDHRCKHLLCAVPELPQRIEADALPRIPPRRAWFAFQRERRDLARSVAASSAAHLYRTASRSSAE